MILSRFWKKHNVLVWNLNEPFTSFIGVELLSFIKNTKKIVAFARSKFVETGMVKAICKGLLIWEAITPFLLITEIEDKNKYEKEMSDFNCNLKEFYAVGATTFLTKKQIGDDETFYLHCLRYYLPKIVTETFNENNLGIGVFTMQGFERRNKESKNTLKRFSNNNGNIVVSNLKRLYDVYKNDHNKI